MPIRFAAGDQQPARRRKRAPADEPPADAAKATETHPGPETDSPRSHEEGAEISAQLSFREAQTALELSLAELQSPDLDVEEMAGLYRRASRYAARCEEVLRHVEQEVMQWDPQQPQEPPQPYQG
ncbi:MAG: exodeoxyribonuclease VII small subunit [Cyanobium sp.]